LLATADSPRAVGAWVRFENGQERIQFTLDPQEVRLLTFTVAFPADATPGDHAGGIVASVVEEGSQVSVDRRVATALFARVSGDLQPRLTLASFDATYQGDWWNPLAGTLKVLYTVDNPGNVALAANVSMTAVTWFGIPASEVQGGGVPVLLPGNSATYEFDLTGVGQWGYLNPSAKLVPFSDAQNAAMQVAVAAVSRDTVVIAVPWMILILAGATAAIVTLLRWRRRREDA
jgi:dihydroorotate dehydrogenase (fumarate)